LSVFVDPRSHSAALQAGELVDDGAGDAHAGADRPGDVGVGRVPVVEYEGQVGGAGDPVGGFASVEGKVTRLEEGVDAFVAEDREVPLLVAIGDVRRFRHKVMRI
jgi:hypothetical protein